MHMQMQDMCSHKIKKRPTKLKINNIIVYSLWFGSDVPHATVRLIEIEISGSPAVAQMFYFKF